MLLFIQIRQENGQPLLIAMNMIEAIGPHSFVDKDGESVHGCIIMFKWDGDERRKSHFIHMNFLELTNKLRTSSLPICVLEAPAP